MFETGEIVVGFLDSKQSTLPRAKAEHYDSKENKRYPAGSGFGPASKMSDEKKTKHWITIGAPQEKDGPYYATCSTLPGVIFLVPAAQFEEMIKGNVSYFSKQ